MQREQWSLLPVMAGLALLHIFGLTAVGHPSYTPLGLPAPGVSSRAYAINDADQVAGYASDGTNFHPFRWTPGVGMVDLGTLGGSNSYAYAINNSGSIVGYSQIAGGGARAFLYQDGTMYDLNTLIPAGSGWILGAALDINERGHIAGYGTLNGEVHAFLLVPELHTLMILLAALLVLRRR
jgi:probable HAF family extracellular repeat protein